MKRASEVRQDKFAMVQRWASSGISQKQFCIQESIPFAHFYYWLKKYRKENGPSPLSGKFINLPVPIKSIAGNMYAEIILHNGTSIHFTNKWQPAN